MIENIFPRPCDFAVTVKPLLGSYFYDELIKTIDFSSLSIYAIQYQWKWNIHQRHSRVQRLGASIIRAKNRNVGVNIILHSESPKKHITKINSVTNNHLSRAGCNVRMLRTVSLLHTKLWIVDSRFTFIGSHNISTRSLSINEEVSVKIESVRFASFMLKYFNNLWGSR